MIESNERLKELIDGLKHKVGWIIAAAFSMITFLLSLIKQRTIFLDIGLIFLLISIIMHIEFTKLIIKIDISKDIEDIEKDLKNSLKYTFAESCDILGSDFFLLSLIYLFSHFKIYILSIISIVYLTLLLSVKIITDLKELRTYFRHIIITDCFRGFILFLIILSIFYIFI